MSRFTPWRTSTRTAPILGVALGVGVALVVMRSELREHAVELRALLRLERREQLVVEAARDCTVLGEYLLPRGREAHEVATAVSRVASALDEAVLLEVVEETDERAPVEAERVGDRRLRLARSLVEDGEDAVVQRRGADDLERLVAAVLAGPAEPLEQECGAVDELARRPRIRFLLRDLCG